MDSLYTQLPVYQTENLERKWQYEAQNLDCHCSTFSRVHFQEVPEGICYHNLKAHIFYPTEHIDRCILSVESIEVEVSDFPILEGPARGLHGYP